MTVRKDREAPLGDQSGQVGVPKESIYTPPQSSVSPETDMLLRALITLQRQSTKIESLIMQLFERIDALEQNMEIQPVPVQEIKTPAKGSKAVKQVQEAQPSTREWRDERGVWHRDEGKKSVENKPPWYKQKGIIFAAILVVLLLIFIYIMAFNGGKIPGTHLRFK